MTGSKIDKVSRGISMGMKLFVSALWGAGGVLCFATGAWPAGLVALAYLGYLWLLGGRWLIY